MTTESEIRRGLNLDTILRNVADVKAQKLVYLSKCIFRIVGCNSLKKGCWFGTQISGSGFSSRHLQ